MDGKWHVTKQSLKWKSLEVTHVILGIVVIKTYAWSKAKYKMINYQCTHPFVFSFVLVSAFLP